MSNPLVPIPDEIYEKAKALYMEGVQIAEIAKQTGVHPGTIGQWRTREKWADERALRSDDFISELASARKITLARIMHAGIEQIERTIHFVSTRPDPMTVAEASKMSDLVSNVYNMSRLDNKESTANVAVSVNNKKLSADEIREAITSDPFFTKEAKE